MYTKKSFCKWSNVKGFVNTPQTLYINTGSDKYMTIIHQCLDQQQIIVNFLNTCSSIGVSYLGGNIQYTLCQNKMALEILFSHDNIPNI